MGDGAGIAFFLPLTEEYEMITRYALLCGSAPESFMQKKLADMHDFLVSADGGSWREQEILEFPNGLPELMLECALNRVIESGTEEILLYICTESPVADGEKSVWLGGEEIRRDMIARYAGEQGARFQVVYDACRELVSEESLGYEPLRG